ncbi:MotB2 [Desulforapulum autotrophicum HRM2]|uniref:MotB2 n=1 Tax=Desulforapulum autotrophicum (strain ATCC 43914 / DSM 3382 / VKM B-1955 / HRM2) TaxID=177437 RepID=C0QJD9_DESAH|nr:OmpA family protein [Desulforapulum autotrophicum]ACN15952.1 MotB2 [Desulforapulum autotrophicum HRM2]
MPRRTITNSLVSTDDEAGWLVTYADLMTLLLVFFILLFSLSNIDRERYKAAIETVKLKINLQKDPIGMIEFMEIPDALNTKITIEDITGLRSRQATLIRDVNRFIVNREAPDTIKTHVLDGKVIVTINGQTLFDSGSANLKQGATAILDRIVAVVFEYPEYSINIKGYTDDIPIETAQFPSNWELSAIRATTVLKHLIQKGINPKRLTATGYADMEPLVPNTSDTNRAINRRVEFVLEKKATPY